jgi:hypothetical protein
MVRAAVVFALVLLAVVNGTSLGVVGEAQALSDETTAMECRLGSGGLACGVLALATNGQMGSASQS